ncbi:MAG: hypothetical protein CK426_07275 [Legionella sp.]|nr:MAG: hypothetical protein CK423_04495 [Legionella sp.]PJD98023.1 MAG: hypothetical protein CK426_07275 [Legionella sp.]
MRNHRSIHAIHPFTMACSALLLLSLSPSSMAASYQASVYGGGTSTTFNHIGPVTFLEETDTLNPTNTLATSGTWGLAAALRTNTLPEGLKKCIEEVSFGPEFFYVNGNSTGDVWQYQLPEMNNLTYKISTSSYRLLATNEITFKPLAPKTFPFFAWGIGFAANESSYQEYPRATYDSPGLSLAAKTQYQFAYTFGGGLKIDVSDIAHTNHPVLLSFRYLYAHLGSADVSNQSSTVVTTPIEVNLYTQTWVAGLTYLF